ncbi:MAG: phosphoribosyltransferase [Eubacteriales bacterium]|nr:phosphoribosyltransferase [Eubacteriales bacterium]
MESKMFKIYAREDEQIQLKIFPGHFVTPQSHITHYMDITTMKSRCSEAKRIARVLAKNYETTTPVDTILCMDGLEVVGAYLADELTKAGILSMNAHQTIYVTSPEYNVGQMIFRDNIQMMIKGKNILILNGSVTTGETLAKAVASILYYGGKISGIAAIFSAVSSVAQLPVCSIFQQKDIPSYGTYRGHDCPLCRNKQKIDAMVNGYGYSKI